MISVIIPAYNEEKLLPQCLAAFSAQTYKGSFEIIVVDNNSTDDTKKIIQSFSGKIVLHYVLETRKGRGAARARGFKEAKGELFLSTDADTIVPLNWVEQLHNSLQDKNIVAVSGTSQINDCDWFTNSALNVLQPVAMHFYNLVIGHYWLSGFNFGIRRTAYEQSGGFDSELTAQEDIDLSYKVAKVGRIKFINLPVLFSGRRFKKGLLSGSWPYLKTYVEYLFYKKKDINLPDIR